MPTTRPTLQQLVDSNDSELNARLPGADARLFGSNLYVLSRMHAGAMHALYGALDAAQRNAFIDTADGEYLQRLAAIYGVDRLPASVATGYVQVTATAGTVIAAGTSFVRADGFEYQSSAGVTVPVSGVVLVPVAATEAGATGNATPATAVISSIAGATITVVDPVGGITTGADEETDDHLRDRALRRLRYPPHGGAQSDYVMWALEVPGVDRAWCQPLWAGLGTVRVLFTWGGAIPTPAQVALVQAYITAPNRAPVAAVVSVIAPVPYTVDVTIAGLQPNSAAVQAAVTEELQDLIYREGEPGALIPQSHFSAAISAATGEYNHTLMLPAAGSVVTVPDDGLAVLGTVTFV